MYRCAIEWGIIANNHRLIPKADRKKIHEYLFRGMHTQSQFLFRKPLIRYSEGVCVAKKDYNLPQHQQIETKNLYVRSSLTSLQHNH
jgi:small subunit ribosomal protein S10e